MNVNKEHNLERFSNKAESEESTLKAKFYKAIKLLHPDTVYNQILTFSEEEQTILQEYASEFTKIIISRYKMISEQGSFHNAQYVSFNEILDEILHTKKWNIGTRLFKIKLLLQSQIQPKTFDQASKVQEYSYPNNELTKTIQKFIPLLDAIRLLYSDNATAQKIEMLRNVLLCLQDIATTNEQTLIINKYLAKYLETASELFLNPQRQKLITLNSELKNSMYLEFEGAVGYLVYNYLETLEKIDSSPTISQLKSKVANSAHSYGWQINNPIGATTKYFHKPQ
jgi:hypothetical protein